VIPGLYAFGVLGALRRVASHRAREWFSFSTVRGLDFVLSPGYQPGLLL